MSKFKVIVGAIGGVLGAFLGGLDGLLTALLVAVVIDYLTGVLAAGREGKLSSDVGLWGLAKKVLIFLLVGLANTLDVYVLGGAAPLRTAVIFFYLANEGLSVLENFARIGIPFPEKLKDILAQLKDKK